MATTDTSDTRKARVRKMKPSNVVLVDFLAARKIGYGPATFDEAKLRQEQIEATTLILQNLLIEAQEGKLLGIYFATHRSNGRHDVAVSGSFADNPDDAIHVSTKAHLKIKASYTAQRASDP